MRKFYRQRTTSTESRVCRRQSVSRSNCVRSDASVFRNSYPRQAPKTPSFHAVFGFRSTDRACDMPTDDRTSSMTLSHWQCPCRCTIRTEVPHNIRCICCCWGCYECCRRCKRYLERHIAQQRIPTLENIQPKQFKLLVRPEVDHLTVCHRTGKVVTSLFGDNENRLRVYRAVHSDRFGFPQES